MSGTESAATIKNLGLAPAEGGQGRLCPDASHPAMR
jgi:hypothetical protein